MSLPLFAELIAKYLALAQHLVTTVVDFLHDATQVTVILTLVFFTNDYIYIHEN